MGYINTENVDMQVDADTNILSFAQIFKMMNAKTQQHAKNHILNYKKGKNSLKKIVQPVDSQLKDTNTAQSVSEKRKQSNQ